jgi:GDPmannose 4,6-dehydratase
MSDRFRRALIFGVSGQDGAYLAANLLQHGYEVHGTTRGPLSLASNLQRIGISQSVRMHVLSQLDATKVKNLIESVAPDEIYNLAGQSSVRLSFLQPEQAFTSHALGTLNVLEAIRSLRSPARLYNASSSECFGDTGPAAADENTPFRPFTPYGVAKAAAALLVKSYRETFGLFACSGMMFNHESPLRPHEFFATRVVDGAIDIANKRINHLELGDLKIVRDLGWAPDFVESMRLMLQQSAPEDLVIATGVKTSLEFFVECVFARLGLNWKDYVMLNNTLVRQTDIAISVGNPTLAMQRIRWGATVKMPALAARLVDMRQNNCFQ